MDVSHGPALAPEVDEGLVVRAGLVEALHELFALAYLALKDGAEVGLALDDVGREKKQKVGLGLLGALGAEEPAEHRDVAQEGDLGFTHVQFFSHQTADNHGLLILDHDHGFGRSFGGRGAQGVGGVLDLAQLFFQFDADVVALVDLGFEL